MIKIDIMKNKEEIRWLQLSNLNTVDFDELTALASGICNRFSQSIDFVAIPGDLNDSGLKYEKACLFLGQLVEGIQKEKIIIVPGDRDIYYGNKVKNKTESEKIIKRIYGNAKKYNQDVFLQESERNILNARFVRFARFCEGFYDGAVDLHTNYINEQMDGVSLLCINTAFTSNENGAEEQFKFIDKNGLDNVINKRKTPCIAIMYHDYHEIAAVQRKYFSSKLRELGVIAILCGHKCPDFPDYVEVDQKNSIPIFSCSYFGARVEGVKSCFKILEYSWKSDGDTILINGYEWNCDTSEFKLIGKDSFRFKNTKTVQFSAQKSGEEIKGFCISKYFGYLKGIFIMAASALITILLLLLILGEKGELSDNYKGIASNGEVVFENKKILSNVSLHTIGQIIVITKGGMVFKTYIIDEMYEKSRDIHDTNKFVFKRLECPLADACVEKFSSELEQLLKQEGYDKDEIVVKEIGLVAICLSADSEEQTVPYYYILDGDSLYSLDKNTAIAKMNGGKLTDENWGNMDEREKILAEFRECVLQKLKN